MSNLLRVALDRLLPQSCVLCGTPADGEPVCGDCMAELPREAVPACKICALPLPFPGVCGRCLKAPPAYDATHAALAYAFPADRLVQALKYRQCLSLARYFSGLLLATGHRPEAECVVPVPMHASSLRKRGFNQAVEIARPLACAWGLPLWLDVARRVRAGPRQADLKGIARRRNVRGAFEAGAEFYGRSVSVVDDVMTTGATLQSFARELKRAGAVRVENVVVARTL